MRMRALAGTEKVRGVVLPYEEPQFDLHGMAQLLFHCPQHLRAGRRTSRRAGREPKFCTDRAFDSSIHHTSSRSWACRSRQKREPDAARASRFPGKRIGAREIARRTAKPFLSELSSLVDPGRVWLGVWRRIRRPAKRTRLAGGEWVHRAQRGPRSPVDRIQRHIPTSGEGISHRNALLSAGRKALCSELDRHFPPA